MKLLLSAGAYVNICGYYYKTPLHLAAECNSIPIIKMLLAHGANPYLEDFSGLAPM